jgi:hypothetical protein
LPHIRLAPCHRTARHPIGIPPSEASHQPGVDQPAGDPSKSPQACRGAAAVEEVAAERGSAVESEQYCSGWPSSASRAGKTAPESEVEASAVAGRYPGCSAPAGQNRCRCSWCSPSVYSRTKFIRDRYCTILERKLWPDKVESKECTVLPPNGLSQFFYYLIQVCIKVDLHEQV